MGRYHGAQRVWKIDTSEFTLMTARTDEWIDRDRRGRCDAAY